MQGLRDQLQKMMTKNLNGATSSHVTLAGSVMTIDEKMQKLEDDMKFIGSLSTELHQRQRYLASQKEHLKSRSAFFKINTIILCYF